MILSTQGLEYLLALFYPNLCPACQENAPIRKTLFCLTCERKLPTTDFHQEKENAFTERFWGRLPIRAGAALYHFVKGGRTQRLIHQLKYKGRKDIGLELGRRYGRQLKNSSHFSTADIIVPVPLHPKKERRRGYNQSLYFANGLSESMNIPVLPEALKRKSYADSQTEKSRIQRLENVMQAFDLNQSAVLKGKYILLVDDVLTTGATLEACGLKLLQLEGTTLSMATIAMSN